MLRTSHFNTRILGDSNRRTFMMVVCKTHLVLLSLIFTEVSMASASREHQSSLPPPPTRIEDTTPYPAASDNSIPPLTPQPDTPTKHYTARETPTQGRNFQQSDSESPPQGRGILEMGGTFSRVMSAVMGVALRAAGNYPQQSSRPFPSPATPAVQGPPVAVAESPAGRLAGVITAALHLLGVRAQTLSNVAVNGIIYIAQMIANAFAIPTPTPTTYHPPPPRKKQGSGKRRGPDVQGQGQGQGQGQNQRQRQGQNKRRVQGTANVQAQPQTQQHSTHHASQYLRNTPTTNHRDQQGTKTNNPHARQNVKTNQDSQAAQGLKGSHYDQEINFVPVQPPKRGFIHRKDFLQSNKQDYRMEEPEQNFGGQDVHGGVKQEQMFGEMGNGQNEEGEANEEWPKYEDPDGPDLLQWLMMQQKNSGKGRALVEEASRPGLGWRAAAALPASNPCVRLLVCSLAPVVSAMQRALRPAFAAQPSGEQGNYSMPRAATLARAADNCEARYPECRPLETY